MKNLHVLFLIGALVPACDQVGDLGEHEDQKAASGDGGEGEPKLCLGEDDCGPGQACDHSECLSGCGPGDACPDVCHGACVGAGGEEGGSAEGEGGGEEGGGEEGGGETCGPDDCAGPAPGAPNYLCPDGTVAGPACLEGAGGACEWGFVDCPPFECTAAECGPAPGAPNFECDDGETIGGPGPCQQLEDGTCGYPWVECPEPVCMDEQGSCAGGESCCDGLQCCAGIPVPPGEEFCAAICPISDKNKKENFIAVDTKAVLDKVSQLEISTWNYKFEDDAIRHLGPMAQDFKSSFDIGATDKSIFTVDADGVALASIQALSNELETLEAENKALKRTVGSLAKRLRKLERTRK